MSAPSAGLKGPISTQKSNFYIVNAFFMLINFPNVIFKEEKKNTFFSFFMWIKLLFCFVLFEFVD